MAMSEMLPSSPGDRPGHLSGVRGVDDTDSGSRAPRVSGGRGRGSRAAQTVAVDFDGVIHAYSKGWNGGLIYDPPVEGALEGLVDIIDAGYRICVHTCRDDSKGVHRWITQQLAQAGYDPTYTDHIRVSRTKPIAVAYIDDRAIAFEDWPTALHQLRRKFKNI